MTATTLPTSRPVTQDWNQDFEWLNGVHYPNGFYDSIGWRGHNGIDYGCWEGDPVEAVCDGVIDFAGDGNNHWLLSGGGNALLLRNDDLGITFEYLHLSAFKVRQGQSVKRGQVIALSGNTGISSAPHLHIGAIPSYNVNVNNGYRGRVDPTPFLYGPMNPDYAPKVTTQAAPKPEGFLMALSDKQQTELYNRVMRYVDSKVSDVPKRVWGIPVKRGGKQVSALQELADAKTLLIKQQATIDALTALVKAQGDAA